MEAVVRKMLQNLNSFFFTQGNAFITGHGNLCLKGALLIIEQFCGQRSQFPPNLWIGSNVQLQIQ
jgi:hypothetical protein